MNSRYVLLSIQNVLLIPKQKASIELGLQVLEKLGLKAPKKLVIHNFVLKYNI